MHTDSIFARRTAAGAPVVHGIHTLLWMLDAIAARHPEVTRVATLKVRFRQMVYYRDRVEIRIILLSTEKLRAQATIDGVEVVGLSAALGPAVPHPAPVLDRLDDSLPRRTTPYEFPAEEMAGKSGRVPFAGKLADWEREFPNAARLLGARRIAALGCSSYLVGMVVPGLHSIYAGFDLDMTDEGPKDELAYAVTSVDQRFRRVQIAVGGAGVFGTVHAVIRPSPVSQSPIERVALLLVDRGEFAASTSLVVGGSRGIGEATAKLLAAAGGRVIITYSRGKIEADNLAAEINHFGGHCETFRYDIYRDAKEQLQSLCCTPTHLYYFATPIIHRRKRQSFAAALYEEFNAFFVHGFSDLIEASRVLWPGGIVAFYPSSEFVVDRPAEMTEYAMSKAAAEVLCNEMGKSLPGVHIIMRRLPRMLTDQTASLDTAEVEDPLPVMLPIIREMHGTCVATNSAQHDSL